MLIEQIFEFRGSAGPTGRICTPTAGCFHEKTIIFDENLRGDCYLLVKIAEGNVPYFPLAGPNHLQNLTPKCKILNVFWI